MAAPEEMFTIKFRRAVHLEQLLEVGVVWVEVEAVLAPLRDGGAVEDHDVEVGVQQQDAVRRYRRHVQQHLCACTGSTLSQR